MNPSDQLRFSIHDLIDGIEVGPSHVSLALLGEFQKDVSEFLKGSSRDVDISQVHLSIDQGSLRFTASGLLSATNLWKDIELLSLPNALSSIDPKRASILARWQLIAKESPHRGYSVADIEGRTFVVVDAHTNFAKTDDVWVRVEKYLHGRVVDLGGKTKANVHLELENGQSLTVGATHELLAKEDKNRLYRNALLHVTAEENLHTGELRNLHLLSFDAHHPSYDEGEFLRMVELGTKAWEGIPNATDWLDSLRGGKA